MSDATQHAGHTGIRGHEEGLAQIGYPGKLAGGEFLEDLEMELITVAQRPVQGEEPIELGPIGSVSLLPA